MPKQTQDNIKNTSEMVKPTQQIQQVQNFQEVSGETLLNLITNAMDDVLHNRNTNLDEIERRLEENHQIETLEYNGYQNLNQDLEEMEDILRTLNNNNNNSNNNN